MGGWVSEVWDKWHSLHVNTHYKHENSVLNLIWPKSEIGEFWKTLFNQKWEMDSGIMYKIKLTHQAYFVRYKGQLNNICYERKTDFKIVF